MKRRAGLFTLALLIVATPHLASAEGLEVCGHPVKPNQKVLTCNVTENAFQFKALSEVKGLQSLGISPRNYQLDSKAMSFIGEAKNLGQTLEVLRITNQKGLKTDDFKNLEHLSALRELNLQGTSVTDEALASIAKLQNLEILRLDNTTIDGSGFKHLAKMKKLKEISFGYVTISKENYLLLGKVSSLRRVGVNRTGLSKEDVEALSEFLPKVRFMGMGSL